MEQVKDYYKRDYANEREFNDSIKNLPDDKKEKRVNMRKWYLTTKIGTAMAVVKVSCVVVVACAILFMLLG